MQTIVLYDPKSKLSVETTFIRSPKPNLHGQKSTFFEESALAVATYRVRAMLPA
jgi:hypothetical protein